MKSSSYSVANSVVQVFSSIVSGVLIARLLGAGGKGEVYLVQQFALFGGTLISLGVPSSLIYFLKQKKIESAGAFISVLVSMLLSGVLLLLLWRFGNSELVVLTGGDLDPVFLDIILVMVFLQLAVHLNSHVVMGMENGVVLNSLYRMISNLSYIIPLFLFFVFRNVSVFGVLALLIFANLVHLVLALVHIIRNREGRLSLLPIKVIGRMIKYGLMIFLCNLMMTSLIRIDTFLVQSFLGFEELGRYSVVVGICGMLLVVPRAVGVAHFPHMAGQSVEKSAESASLICRLSVLLGVLGVGLLYVIAYPVLMIFGSDFISALPALYVLIPGVGAMAAIFPLANFLNSTGHPRLSFYCFSSMLVSNVILNLILLKPLGIMGASLSSSLTYFLAFVIFVFVFKSKTGLSARATIVPTRKDVALIINSVLRRNRSRE